MVTVFSWLALSVSSRDCLSFVATVGKLSVLPWPCSGKSDNVTCDRIFIWTWGGRASLAFFVLGKTESARLFLIPQKEGLARLPDFEAPILPSFVSQLSKGTMWDSVVQKFFVAGDSSAFPNPRMAWIKVAKTRGHATVTVTRPTGRHHQLRHYRHDRLITAFPVLRPEPGQSSIFNASLNRSHLFLSIFSVWLYFILRLVYIFVNKV